VSAADVAEKLRELLAVKPLVRVVFAAGESQSSFLDALSIAPGLDWQRVECFNIDDFWDRRMPREYTCGAQTTRQLYDKVCPYRVELVRYNAPEAETEAKRFEKLLRERSLDIVCQGIGTSGHLALNEPEDTDFNDPAWVRVTDVVEQSKRQLKEDPNFKSLGYIPEKGITMTIPAILSASHIFTMVPLRLKREILTRLAEELEPTVSLPASILRAKGSLLYVDRDSCPRCWV
jgi:glucosamine-6-phosphate deaminase